jgi:Flp pilus assembly protein TadD
MITSGLCRVRYLLIMVPSLAAACATLETGSGPVASANVEQRDKSLVVAEAAYESGRYSEALAEYTRLLETDPRDEEARLGMADSYMAAGGAKQASVIYATLVNSETPKIRLGAEQGRGLSLLMLGDLDAGHTQLLEVAAEEPSLWRTWNALGWSYDKRRDWLAAEDAYRHAVGLSPVPHVVLNNWGMSLVAQGNPAAAAVKFKRAVEIRPDFDVARNNLQVALGLQGKYREALAATDDHRKPAALNNVGYAALLRGDRERAEQYFVKAVEDSPRYNRAAWKNLKYIDESTAK